MYLVLDTDGVWQDHEGTPTLKALQQYCDGDIEVLAHDELPFVMWMNESKADHMGNRLKMNARATTLMNNALWPGDHINGMVVITGLADEEGEVTPLDLDTLNAITERLQQHR